MSRLITGWMTFGGGLLLRCFGFLLRRAELEDAEGHLGHRLVAGVPGVAGGDAPAFPEAGLLRPDDAVQPGGHGEPFAVPQVPVVEVCTQLVATTDG
ncbi:hypothetical protein [Saccharopolyspora spinosa]|uniref:hypothetical protein n=1 Tax=Saccharopolyspora spinosa TaxID=60894 RepID=UPI001EEEC148|nr:hypothetical protein [Saccharopolyspora spinosa]